MRNAPWLPTQPIETGVDLDFAMVLRAVAPLDAVIQPTGQCNREARPGSSLIAPLNATA